MKGKSHIGRLIKDQWVFGGIERESRKGFLIAVPNRKATTLIKLIKNGSLRRPQ